MPASLRWAAVTGVGAPVTGSAPVPVKTPQMNC
jgi:hypothetical protein